MSEEPGPENRTIFWRCRAISCTASATEENGRSAMTSTPSLSYHWVAIEDPMSALFWWSAKMISIFLPITTLPACSAAMRAAITDPCPDRSAFMPVWSLSTPMRMVSPEARAVPDRVNDSARPSHRATFLCIVFPVF